MTSLHTPACDLLGCRYPVVLAGMGGVARAELVAAVTQAGGFGFLGMVRESPELIRQEVEAVRRAGHRRFGVNLIPAATPPALLEAELAMVIELGVPVVCLFWDIDAGIVRRLRDAGILVVYQVGSVEEARAAEAAGAQLVIAQGVEAGGHVRGTQPLWRLLPEVCDAVTVPVLAAGGITDGADLAAAMGLGAQGVVLGTAMIATPESFAHDVHKQRLLAAAAEDTVLTHAFHINWPEGAAVRVLATEVTSGARGDPFAPGRTVIGDEEGRPIYLFSTDSPLRTMTGEFEAMALYAGQGVGRIGRLMGAGQRVAELVDAAEDILRPPAVAAAVETSSPVCYAAEVDPEYMGYLGRPVLVEKLRALQNLARSALRAALAEEGAGPRDAETRRAACWATLLGRLAEKPGPSAGMAAAGGPIDGPSSPRLVEGARALLPVVAEPEIRAALCALVDEFGGRAGAEENTPLQAWRGGRVMPG
jgi:nitronate monooxygenase